VAALESGYCIAANTPGFFLDLSEQALVSCVSAGYGCSGGDPMSAAEFLLSQGTCTEACFPYTGTDGDCADACPGWRDHALKITGYAYVDHTIGALKTALLQAPLQVGMNVFSDFYYYRSGVYEFSGGSDMGGHAVLAVGYVDTPGKYGGGYFIVKNSWGSGWGDGGFFLIGYSQVDGPVGFGQLAHAYTVDAPVLDNYEPDDTPQAAKGLNVGVRQTRSIQPAGDRDWARFLLTSKADVTLETSGVAGGDTSMWLYDSASLTTPIASDGNGGAGSYSRIARTLDPGTYYVRVSERRPAEVISTYYLSLTIDAWPYVPPALWAQSFSRGAGGWSTQDLYPRVLADVSGDGRADVVGFGTYGVYVSLSTGTGFAAPVLWLQNYGASAGGWSSQDLFPRVLGDVDGDGKADVVGFGNYGVYVSLSTGGSFAPPALWSRDFCASAEWSSQDRVPRTVADVDGDGKADVVGFGPAGVYVSLSTGMAFAPAELWVRNYGTSAGGWSSQNQYPRAVADLTGDGKADVVGFGNAGVFVSASTGASFTAPALWLADFGYSAGGWSSQDLYPRVVADVNGDGKADIVGFRVAGAYISLSTGSRLGAPALRKRFFGTVGGWSSNDLFPRIVTDVDGDARGDLAGFGSAGVFVSLAP
jgi:hypothetical protein